MVEHSKFSKHESPGVFDVIGVAHRDQRQLLPPSISHIGRDIEKVLEKEKGRKSRAWDLTLEDEISRNREWGEELEQRSAHHPEGKTKPPEQEMPAFVDR